MRVMRVLILDIGNSKTKCYVFDVDNPYGLSVPKENRLLYEDHQDTNRGHPWDMTHDLRTMLNRAMKDGRPDYGILTAFGDAFIYYDPKNNGRPRFVFADAEVTCSVEPVTEYPIGGFPLGNIEIQGVCALRLSEGAAWEHILPVNVAIGRELGGNANWWHWDITQASATGNFRQVPREWANPHQPSVCQPHDEVGMFKGMPLLAGGIDNAFLDTPEQTPYIVAGTWLVVSTIHETFTPTETQRQHGIRWYISGNGRYLAQTVRRSERPLTEARCHKIISDLQAMGYGGDTPQKIRVLGSYSKDLCKKLNPLAKETYFDFMFQDYGIQHSCVASYVYMHKQ